MVNWRENVEFFYVLFIVISAIVVFFYFYDSRGLTYAGLAAVVVVLVETAVAFFAFETDRAIAAWEKIGKEDHKQ
jgi:hypothetical protein